MRLFIISFLLNAAVQLFFASFSVALQSKRSSTGITTAGDILIGGLIPVHFSPNFAPHPGNSTCRGAFHLRGYKGVEAMLYAVKLINGDPTLLPRVTLGVDIKDTCGSVDYAIMESLSFDFIRSAFTATEFAECVENKDESTGNNYGLRRRGQKFNGSAVGSTNSKSLTRERSDMSECCSRKSRTAAIIGAAFSGVTMATASLTGLFHVPVISYSSTSRLLSDRSRFKYFYRTVPSDNLQAQAVSDLLHKLKWHYIIILASDNEYGRSGITALKQTIHKHASQHVCIVVDELFSRKGTQQEMANIFKKIKQFELARVIILYAEFPDAVYFFKEAKRASLRDYMFIASDSWVGSTEVIQDAGDIFHSIIGLRPPIIPMPKFDSYFMYRLMKNDTDNIWAADCNKSLICDRESDDQCHSEVHHDGYVSYVMDAVFSVAHALHAMLNCSKSVCAKKWNDVDHRDLSQYIEKVNFSGFSQERIFYDEEGSTKGQYDIYHVRKGSSKYVNVGTWSGTLPLNFNFSKNSENDSFELPVSICSNDCKKGEYMIAKSQFPECCWDCAKCDGKSFTNTSHTTNCVDCPKGTWPIADHSDCDPIEASYLHLNEAWAVVIASLSLFGFALVVCTCAVFIKFRGTAVVRAASRQLCHVLLLGIALFYVTPLSYVIYKPSKISCKLLPFMFGLCFVLVVGTILVRTNRVSRIFNEKLLRTGTIRCLGNHWQLFMLGCLLTTELILSITWVFGSSSHVFPEVIYSESSKEASLVCNLAGSEIGFSLWLIYNAGLVVVCTYQAFLVRKVPQNYNESRLIAFNMTTICITVLVYIPSYMGTTAWYRTVISGLLLIFIGTLTWASIFAPKIYIILFRPHKNIPMRPSVSSITLGVITPSPTVLSSLNEQGMPSGQNLLSPYEDKSWDSLWANFDSSRDVIENGAPNEQRDSGDMREDCKDPEDDKLLKRHENSETVRQKKTSVVHFEDEVTKEEMESKDGQVTPRKISSCSQGGILRNSNTSENLENLCNGVTAKKKKHSLVRFQDQVTNYEVNGQERNRNEFPDQVVVSEINFHKKTEEERIPSSVSGDRRNIANGLPEQERKRKISVFAFE